MKELSRDSLVSQGDLEARRVVANRTTRKRYETTLGFPPGFLISPGARRWTWGEVLDWIEQRRALSAGKKHAPPSAAAHRARDRARTRKVVRRKRRAKSKSSEPADEAGAGPGSRRPQMVARPHHKAEHDDHD